ncbi:MAG: SDR family NAD(P)-dependent oxidoreductase [Acidimicrobiia bacterium]
MEFEDRTVIVTGGASGIGRAVVNGFAAGGARVAVADIDAAGAADVAKQHDGAQALNMDVTDTASVAAGVEKVIGDWGRIDILVNVAGWDRIRPFIETDEEFWDRVIAINFRGPLATCHAVLPHMREQGSGVIVNTASEAGRSGSSGEAVYSGAKGGIITFTKALAREVARYGIRANVVAPGLTETPLLQGMIDDGHGSLMDAIKRATPIRRFGLPEEVADAILFMASDRASFITGQTLGVAGGLVM